MPFPIAKPPSKPASAQKPVPFERGSKLSIKKMMREKNVVIPGTGGKIMPIKQYKELLKKRLPYGKIGTDVGRSEAIRVLRGMRTEDKGRPSRERRVLEDKWKLKSGKDY